MLNEQLQLLQCAVKFQEYWRRWDYLACFEGQALNQFSMYVIMDEFQTFYFFEFFINAEQDTNLNKSLQVQ